MRKSREPWSDDADFVEDGDLDFSLDDDFADAELDETVGQPFASAWQRLEDRVGELRLRRELAEWDYWDEYLSTQ